MKVIYIQTIPSEKSAVLVNGHEVVHLTFDRLNQLSSVGNIYLGRVTRIDKGLQSAFIDLGHKIPAFLPKKELPQARRHPEKNIENLIHEGMSILVQVIKDQHGNKGPTVTANMTYPGQYFIYMPFGGYIATSKKMKVDEKKNWKVMLESWRAEEEGAIVRTSAQQAEIKDLEEEWLNLREQWRLIAEKAKAVKAPFKLYEDYAIPDRFLRKFASQALDEIVFDEADVAQRVKKTFPHLASKVRWSDTFLKEIPVSADQLIDNLINRKVKLTSGIELVIDKTEACTIIDVNTSSYAGKLSKAQTILQANKEAAREIANQIRLRNISGMILIDFIDMPQRQHQDEIKREMSGLLKSDPTFTKVHGFTNLGILEITRKREGLDSWSLFSESIEPKLSTEAMAYKLERELLSYRNKDTEAFLIEVTSDVWEKFIELVHLDRLKKMLKISVYVTKKTFDHRHYVIKFIGDQNWLSHGNHSKSTIDKLF